MAMADLRHLLVVFLMTFIGIKTDAKYPIYALRRCRGGSFSEVFESSVEMEGSDSGEVVEMKDSSSSDVENMLRNGRSLNRTLDRDSSYSPCDFSKCNCDAPWCEKGFPLNRKKYYVEPSPLPNPFGVLLGMKDDLIHEELLPDLTTRPVPKDGSLTFYTERKKMRLGSRARKLAERKRQIPSDAWIEKRDRATREGKLGMYFAPWPYSRKRRKERGSFRSFGTLNGPPTVLDRFPEVETQGDKGHDEVLKEMVDGMNESQRIEAAKRYVEGSALLRRMNITFEEVTEWMKEDEPKHKGKDDYFNKRNFPPFPDQLLTVPSNWTPGPDDEYDLRYPFPKLILENLKPRPFMKKQVPVLIVPRKWEWPGPERYKSGDSEESTEEDLEMAFEKARASNYRTEEDNIPKRKLFDAEAYVEAHEKRLKMSARQRRAAKNEPKRWTVR